VSASLLALLHITAIVPHYVEQT
jgi:hypothetical protein